MAYMLNALRKTWDTIKQLIPLFNAFLDYQKPRTASIEEGEDDLDAYMPGTFQLNILFDWKEFLSRIIYCQVNSYLLGSFFVIHGDRELQLFYLII